MTKVPTISNQSNNLQSKSMDWFRHEIVKAFRKPPETAARLQENIFLTFV